MGSTAHVRVGVVATAAFLALLLFGLIQHKPASAEPVNAPVATPQQQEQQSIPQDPGFHRHHRGGGGPRPDGSFGGPDGDDDGGGGPPPGMFGGPDEQVPAPSTEGTTES